MKMKIAETKVLLHYHFQDSTVTSAQWSLNLNSYQTPHILTF